MSATDSTAEVSTPSFGFDAQSYADWKAPKEDAALLLWPKPAQLLEETRENHRRFSSAGHVQLLNVPLPEARSAMRRGLGHPHDEAPLVITGHQTELHHPGVWIKNVLIDAIASALDGKALHVAVDTDEPKHLALRWPGGSASFGDKRAAWSGLLPAPAAGELDNVEQEFSAASKAWDFRTNVPEFLDLMKVAAVVWLPEALAKSLATLDRTLGLSYESRLFSPVCDSPAYLLFACHVLANADRFAADYNAALAEYRKRNRIRAAGRPMPDLAVDPQSIEIPFWFDDVANARRSRARVAPTTDGFALEGLDGERFIVPKSVDGWEAAAALGQWLNGLRARLAPRALTLTAVLRLLAADQFVHGIGGGRYDQVLDALIARHWRLAPPRFSVTTATLYFPAAVGQERVCLPCILSEGHRLKHAVLGDEKFKLVEEIAAAPRYSSRRAELFSQMHHRLADSAAHPTLRDWEKRLADAASRHQEQSAHFDRELFYALQPRNRLEAMISRVRGAFAVDSVQ